MPDDHYENWLIRESLELYVIINLASGEPPGKLPIEGPVRLPRHRQLKAEIGAKIIPGILRSAYANIQTSLRLRDLWRFVSEREHGWDWLKNFCEEWASVSGINLEKNIKQECFDWLVELFSQSLKVKTKTKATCRKEFEAEFGSIETRPFDRVWGDAITHTGTGKSWGRSGPIPNKRITE